VLDAPDGSRRFVKLPVLQAGAEVKVDRAGKVTSPAPAT
jgi:hypothetical protein